MSQYFAIILLVSVFARISGLSDDILVRLQELTTRIEDKIYDITRLEEKIHQLETNSSGTLNGNETAIYSLICTGSPWYFDTRRWQGSEYSE